MRMQGGKYGELRQYDDDGKLVSIDWFEPHLWKEPVGWRAVWRRWYNKHGWVLPVAGVVVVVVATVMDK